MTRQEYDSLLPGSMVKHVYVTHEILQAGARACTYLLYKGYCNYGVWHELVVLTDVVSNGIKPYYSTGAIITVHRSALLDACYSMMEGT